MKLLYAGARELVFSLICLLYITSVDVFLVFLGTWDVTPTKGDLLLKCVFAKLELVTNLRSGQCFHCRANCIQATSQC